VVREVELTGTLPFVPVDRQFNPPPCLNSSLSEFALPSAVIPRLYALRESRRNAFEKFNGALSTRPRGQEVIRKSAERLEPLRAYRISAYATRSESQDSIRASNRSIYVPAPRGDEGVPPFFPFPPPLPRHFLRGTTGPPFSAAAEKEPAKSNSRLALFDHILHRLLTPPSKGTLLKYITRCIALARSGATR